MKNSLYKSKKFNNRVKFLMRSQYWTKKEFKKFQINNLKNLIFYVQNNIPFYHFFFDLDLEIILLSIIKREILEFEFIQA